MVEHSPAAGSRYTLVLVLVAVALGGAALYERSQVAELTSTIAGLQTQLADRSKATALANQEKCAQRAAFLFKDLGLNDTTQQRADYESHFSERHNKCFIKVSTSAKDLSWSNVSLMDAFDQRDYGSVFTALTLALRATLCY